MNIMGGARCARAGEPTLPFSKLLLALCLQLQLMTTVDLNHNVPISGLNVLTR